MTVCLEVWSICFLNNILQWIFSLPVFKCRVIVFFKCISCSISWTSPHFEVLILLQMSNTVNKMLRISNDYRLKLTSFKLQQTSSFDVEEILRHSSYAGVELKDVYTQITLHQLTSLDKTTWSLTISDQSTHSWQDSLSPVKVSLISWPWVILAPIFIIAKVIE